MRIFITTLFVLGALVAAAQETCTLTSSGTSATATWSCTGASSEPIDMVANAGNVVVIPATLSYEHTDNNKTWEASILLEEETSPGNVDGGTLIFSSKLNLGSGTGCGYTLTMETGSLIIDDGGGADRLIICGEPVIGGPGALPWPPGGYTGPEEIDEDGGTLPVELLFFNASEKDGLVDIAWATASEENFDYFSIERSADGVDFKEVAQVEGSGYSMNRIDYSFTDEFPLEGLSYYRLRSIDFDGYTEVFETVIVQVEGLAKDFNIYPNPIANGSFRIQTNFVAEEPLQLIVYNSLGTIEDEFVVDSWLTAHELEISKKGVYLFKIFTPGGTIIKRVLVN